MSENQEEISNILPTTSERNQQNVIGNYFSDGRRRVDYILVYNSHKTDFRRQIYLETLIENELHIEEAPSLVYPDLVFVKVNCPKHLLIQYAEKFDIPIKYQQKTYLRAPIPKFKFFRTELTSQDITSPNYIRAKETFSGDKPKSFLSYERSLIVFNILKRIPYGHNNFQVGILHLVSKGVFIAAYPLHDGTSRWSDDSNVYLNDRQLLERYWSNIKMFLKTQPLDVIERYFGDNIAIYFAWLSFYNKMLLWPMFMGLIVSILDWISLTDFGISTAEVCNSDLLLCPTVTTRPLRNLNQSCINYKLAYVYDNSYTIAFGLVISFWATIYMVLWQRKQAVLALRWNIRDSQFEEQDIRTEFEKFAKHVRLSEFGEPEQYIPIFTQTWRITVTLSAIIFLIILVVATITAITICEIAISQEINSSLGATAISSLLTVIAIMILRRGYESIVVWLTNLEVPKTQTDFDNSYIIKVFAFSFVNNYGALIYLAFFKGKFYTHPGDPNMYSSKLGLVTDICDPSGCLSEVHILFQILMIFLPALTHISNAIFSALYIWLNREKEKKANIKHSTLPRWEKDFELNEVSQSALLLKYEEMVVQFGFVTLFAFAFPLAPLLALINNLIKIRIDAYNLVTKCRRPQAKRTASIGAWLDIMKFLTYLSVISNACYITFTSDFIPKFYYKHVFDSTLAGYVNFSLSPYKINTSIWSNLNVPNGTICWYPGYRNPPDHKYPYELNYEHYCLLAIKFGFIIVFEHFVIGITALLSYSIPDTPQSVKDKYATETMELRKTFRIKTNLEQDSEMVLTM